MRLTFRSLLALFASYTFLVAQPACALDPALAIAQYKHTSWTIDDGAPRNIVALAQGSSGYLWIGGSTGLFRFDGITFEPILSAAGKPTQGISAITVLRNGDVWIGYSAGGTSIFRDGKLNDVPMPNPDYVMDIVQTPDGSIWATLGREHRQLMRFKNGRWTEQAAQLGYPEEAPIRTIVARDGSLWATTLKSLMVLRNGSTRFERVNENLVGHAALSEDRFGNIWISDGSGSRTVKPMSESTGYHGSARYSTPEARRVAKTLFDRHGNLWGIGDNGIYRLRAPHIAATKYSSQAANPVSRHQQKDGLTADVIGTIMEDREGNLWVGTPLGLDRFRPAKVIVEPMMTKTAFWSDPLLGASDGTVYVGEADAVYRVKPRSLPEVLFRADETQAICEGLDGSIWFVLQDRVVHMEGAKFSSIPGPPTSPHSITDCAVDRQNRIWVAATKHGMYGRVDGKWQVAMAQSPRWPFPPQTMVRAPDGTLLVAFETKSLALFDPVAPASFLIGPSSDIGKVKTLFSASDALFIGGNFGLGRIKDRRISVLSSERYPQFRSVGGIVKTGASEIWVSSAAGIVGVSTAAFNRALVIPRSQIVPMVLDFRDGLPGVQSRDASRAAVMGGDGRIWFATGGGTVWIDPTQFPRNLMRPPVSVSAIRVGSETFLDPKHLRLYAGASSIEFDFAAPSLTIPERVRVLYKLEGADRGWINPGKRRQAFYTNLAPGHYSFRIIAANDDGVWNQQGAVVQVDIPPTFLQSTLFKLLFGFTVLLTIWALYLVRVRQITAKMRLTLEERLAERERVARDLHDTLLQGFQGLIMRFQSVANEIPKDQQARALIERTLDSADEVLTAGRDSIRHLRANDLNDLDDTLAEAAERLQHSHPARFDMVIEGSPRVLHPVVREEVYRIGNEALINAFRHSGAKKIEMVISYTDPALTVGVRDDGSGIDPEILKSGGRQGHFGLIGMRERAQEIEAEFSVFSRPGSGTDVRLSVPGRIAYSREPQEQWWRNLIRQALPRGRATWQKS